MLEKKNKPPGGLNREFTGCFFSKGYDYLYLLELTVRLHTQPLKRQSIDSNKSVVKSLNQPLLTWGLWMKTKPCTKLLRPFLTHSQLLFSFITHEVVYRHYSCWQYNSMSPSYTATRTYFFVTHKYACLFKRTFAWNRHMRREKP